MDCPDDDMYAGFVQGLLDPGRAAAIEGHLDVCGRCAELSAQFGRLYARPAEIAGAPAPAPGARQEDRGAPWLALVQGLMACCHAAWIAVALPAAVRVWSVAAPAPPRGAMALAAAAYTIVWAPPGAALALLAAWGFWRRRGWARAVARWYALVSLPSIVLTPLAAYVLFELRRRSGPDG